MQVTVFAKLVGEAKYATVASLDTGVNWKAADRARLVIYPDEAEWPALAVKAGTR